jgi:fido (protein-threonine AMPylation protein)
MALLEETARALASNGGGLDQSGLAYRLARLYADYNHIHPFREGNGRAGTVLLHTVAALCGRRLNLSAVSRGSTRRRGTACRSAAGGQPPAVPAAIRRALCWAIAFACAHAL